MYINERQVHRSPKRLLKYLCQSSKKIFKLKGKKKYKKENFNYIRVLFTTILKEVMLLYQLIYNRDP